MLTVGIHTMDMIQRHRPLVEMATMALLMAIVGTARWHWIVIVYFVYKVISIYAGDFLRRAFSTLPRDLHGIYLLFSVQHNLRAKWRANRGIHEMFLDIVHKHSNRVAAIDIERDKSFTFRQINELANQFAHYFQDQGFVKGDVIALFMENCPEFVAIWIGLAKIGVISAWINSNLKLEPLSHSINCVKAKAIICNAGVQFDALQSAVASNQLDSNIPVHVYSDDDSSIPTKYLSKTVIQCRSKIAAASIVEPIASSPIDLQTSVLCYIYTSGTTGLPKAAVMKHFRYYWMEMASGIAFNLDHNDRIYVTMPMYHSAAGILGVGQMVTTGACIVIRKKFSATNFWKECIKYECTASQYIGEICRYLLAQPPSPDEQRHQVRVMFGNGLRYEIWPEFERRFGVKRLGEFYGSTEVNTNNKRGACGFFPIYPFLSKIYPLRLIKVDEQTGEPVRGADGLCIPCRPGDTGEMIGRIINRDPMLKFEGYVNKQDTDKKLISNVLKPGDSYFLSGDVLFWDVYGYIFFRDRKGDTFRWKGENVSTTEVEAVLQPVKCISDATVYGVQIPGTEGRAGMAAIVFDETVNGDEMKLLIDIGERLSANLAPYALPQFVRLCKQVDRTGTFKLKKTNLQREGYHLKECGDDRVFYWNGKQYAPLDQDMYQKIMDGTYNRF